jgi:CheY-like chemotaxis protein
MSGRTKRILIVDDSQTALMMTKMLLARTSYDLITAGDGEEGVKKALIEHPDVILLDVVMPKMSGIDACRRLREQEPTRAIPIIMLTTRGEMESIEAGYQAGCNDYLTKPVNGTELMLKLEGLLGQQEP